MLPKRGSKHDFWAKEWDLAREVQLGEEIRRKPSADAQSRGAVVEATVGMDIEGTEQNPWATPNYAKAVVAPPASTHPADVASFGAQAWAHAQDPVTV